MAKPYPDLAPMFSEGDQLVSQASHHVASIPSEATETEAEKYGYFQRMISRPKHQARSSDHRQTSTATPLGIVASNSEEFPAIKTTYHFADYILSSERASPDTLAFVDIIQQVRQGIQEANGLYTSAAVSKFLDAYPGKRTWVEGCLQDTQQTLNDIGVDIDSAWSRDEDGGTVASKLKFEWGLRNQKKLLKRQQQLNQCHFQLTSVVHVMQTVDLCSKPGVIIKEPIHEAPVLPWVPRHKKNTMRGPYSRPKDQLGYNYASISSLTLASEGDRDDLETAFVNSTPVELAGSMPSEISKSQDDQSVLSSQSSEEHLADSPGLLRRPRSLSDHVGQTATSELRYRASIDTTGRRRDSILFSPAAIGIPMVGRRYRATSVDIYGYTEKNRRIPQQLPILKNQPSLAESLADYVLPSPAVRRLRSEEWATSSTHSVPPTSVIGDPTINHAVTAVKEAMTTPQISNDRGLRSIEENQNHITTVTGISQTFAQPQPSSQINRSEITTNSVFGKTEPHTANKMGGSTATPSFHRSPSISTSGSSVSSLKLALFPDEGPVCRPSSQRPSQRILRKKPNTSRSSSQSTTIHRIETTVGSETQPSAKPTNAQKPPAEGAEQIPRFAPPPMIVIDDACQPILANETELPEDGGDEDMASPEFRQRLHGQTQARTMAGNPVRQPFAQPVKQRIGTEQPVPVQPALKSSAGSAGRREPTTVLDPNFRAATAGNEVQTSRSEKSHGNPGEKKPMSAQAKRRAAHARRMQLAFGNGANA